MALLQVPLFKDELLTSFVSRLARANGRASMRDFCRDLGVDPDGVIHGKRASISALEATLSRPQGELLNRAIYRIDTRHTGFLGMKFPAGMVSPSARRFCAACVEEDQLDRSRMPGTRAYGRVHWALSCVEACERHARRLVGLEDFETSDNEAHVTQGRSRTSFHDFCIVLDRWHRLADRRPQGMFWLATAFERFVVDKLSGSQEYGDVLNSMPLSSCIQACELFGLAQVYGLGFRQQQVNDQDLRAARDLGFRTIRDGTRAIHTVLGRLAAREARWDRPIPDEFETLSRLFARKPDVFRPIQMILNKHVEGDRQSSAAGAGQMKVSVGSLAYEVGLPPRTVARYLVQVGCLRRLGSKPEKHLVESDAATSARDVLADLATGSDIREVLGCTLSELRSLATWGLLERVLGPAHLDTRPGTDRYSRKSMIELRTKLIHCSSPTSQGFTPLKTAARTTGLDVGAILVLICQQQLKQVSCHSHVPLFEALLLDVEELVAVSRRMPPYFERDGCG